MTLIEYMVTTACIENGWLVTDARVRNMVEHIERALPQADQSPAGAKREAVRSEGRERRSAQADAPETGTPPAFEGRE